MHREKAMEEATWRFEHGEAPSEEAVKDLGRQDRKKVSVISSLNICVSKLTTVHQCCFV